MFTITRLLSLMLLISLTQCKSTKKAIAYSSETLKIIAITEHSFQHISYLDTDSYGKVACNGVIYLKDNEAIVFDTPVDEATTEELINWLTHTQKVKIKGIIVNHFHEDCIGGLAVFQKNQITAYANTKTANLLNTETHFITFDDQMTLMVGNEKIESQYFGEAHTTDNIVCYIPSEELLFGGCMIKSLGASKGNVADANITQWSKTVSKIKATYPNLKIVVPGHGSYGNTDLLDYTIALFKIE